MQRKHISAVLPIEYRVQFILEFQLPIFLHTGIKMNMHFIVIHLYLYVYITSHNLGIDSSLLIVMNDMSPSYS